MVKDGCPATLCKRWPTAPASAADGVDRGPPNSRLHLIEKWPGAAGQVRQISCQIFCHRRIYADSRRHRQHNSDKGARGVACELATLRVHRHRSLGRGAVPDFVPGSYWRVPADFHPGSGARGPTSHVRRPHGARRDRCCLCAQPRRDRPVVQQFVDVAFVDRAPRLVVTPSSRSTFASFVAAPIAANTSNIRRTVAASASLITSL